MEKIIMSLFSGIIALAQFFFYSQCSQDYDGYRRVNLPDEQLGSVMLPENWEVTTEDGYMYFLDADSGEVIAEEHFRGIYIHDLYYDSSGKLCEEITDERRYNEKFENYVESEGIEASGNSNGGQYGIFLCMYEGREFEMRSLLFIGTNSHYSLEMYVLQEVSTEVLSAIAKSYQYEKSA